MKNIIKVERARNNITQAELAEKVKVARQTIIAIETGRFVPSTTLTFKIAKVLNYNYKPDENFSPRRQGLGVTLVMWNDVQADRWTPARKK